MGLVTLLVLLEIHGTESTGRSERRDAEIGRDSRLVLDQQLGRRATATSLALTLPVSARSGRLAVAARRVWDCSSFVRLSRKGHGIAERDAVWVSLRSRDRDEQLAAR